jgi:D-lactate dehydrogenase (cytochrome)
MSHPFSDAGNAIFPAPDAQLTTHQPHDEASLCALMREAHRDHRPITFVAALTGLTGSAVPLTSGLRIDLGRMTTIADRPGWRRVAPFLLLNTSDPTRGLVAPGISLTTLNETLDGLDLWYPPHPGEMRASIGGNVSTNASGPRTFAFGATRDYVDALRIVLADGDTLTLRRGETYAQGRRFTLKTDSHHLLQGVLPRYVQPSVKHAAGLYVEDDMDLLDLFIGSEGILGAFSEIGLRFLPRREIASEILFFGNVESALSCSDGLRGLKARAAVYPDTTGDGIVALEFFDEGSLALARQDHRFKSVIPQEAQAAVEVELFADDAPSRVHVFSLAERLKCVGSLPAALSGAFRYAVPRRVAEILKERGQPKFGTDFAVPLASFRELYDFYEAMDLEFGKVPAGAVIPRTAKWGHLGDCHLHCNFLCEHAEDQVLARAIYLKLVRKAVSLGGTISAEHGVGKKRVADESGTVHPYLWYLYGDAYQDIEAVKQVFDPKGLLNAGNMVG